MLSSKKPYAALLVCSSMVSLLVGACSGSPQASNTTSNSASGANSAPEAVSGVADNPTTAATGPEPAANDGAAIAAANAPAQPTPADPYPDAINRASLAFNLSQSAQSPDDWRLVASRWQQAIQLMTTVPSSSPNHSEAQEKLIEYRRNLTYAQQRAALPVPATGAGQTVVVSPTGSNPGEDPDGTAASAASAPLPNGTSTAADPGVYRVPIVRRSGGTPVIRVMFNGNQSFEMIVDTGASGTVITQPMARALNVVPIGSTSVATASARNATFLLGRVNSVEVSGVMARDVVVAIAGPELSTGLLGHDFFGNYDVTVRQDVVEFRER